MGAAWIQLTKGVDPANAGAGTERVFVDSADDELKLKSDAGAVRTVLHDGSTISTVAEGAVTAHQAALAIAGTQVSSGTLPDARIQATGVTQHEGSITHNNLGGLTTGDPHTQYQLESEKNGASGYAGLGSDSRIAAAQSAVLAPAAVGATHTMASGDNGVPLLIDDATSLVVTLPASGVATGTVLNIVCHGTGDLTFSVAGTAHFDNATYAAGPTATGKYWVSVICVSSGVYYITGELDLA